ncbi:MAG: CBS domain-containing protein [Bacteroidia bacterium]
MIAFDLITDSIPPVKSADTLQHALDWMAEFGTTQLPVVDDGKLMGIITEGNLLDAARPEAKLAEVLYPGWESAWVRQEAHLYDVLKAMNEYSLEVLPVMDAEDHYAGLITARYLVKRLGDFFAVHEPGGILVLEVPKRDYVLSEVGRIAEGEDAKVLGLNLATNPSTHALELTLKLNVEDLSRVIAAFTRHEYKILSAHHRSNENNEDMKRNYDLLMRFLDD